jgi:hypothetical protein
VTNLTLTSGDRQFIGVLFDNALSVIRQLAKYYRRPIWERVNVSIAAISLANRHFGVDVDSSRAAALEFTASKDLNAKIEEGCENDRILSWPERRMLGMVLADILELLSLLTTEDLFFPDKHYEQLIKRTSSLKTATWFAKQVYGATKIVVMPPFVSEVEENLIFDSDDDREEF